MKLNVYVLMMLLRVSFAPIIHCTGIRGDGTHCERLAQGRGIMYNGIALSPNKERLIVSDTMGMKMLVFNRDVRTGALTLRQHLDLPGSPDNVEIDVYRAAKGVEAYTVGLVNMWHYMAYTDKMGAATDVSEGDDTRCAGGISSIVYDSETGRYSENLEMWQDGNLLSISVASATASDSRLVGSSMEEGFLVCRPPSCATVGDKGNEHCGWEQPMSVTESNPAVEEAATE